MSIHRLTNSIDSKDNFRFDRDECDTKFKRNSFLFDKKLIPSRKLPRLQLYMFSSRNKFI